MYSTLSLSTPLAPIKPIRYQPPEESEEDHVCSSALFDPPRTTSRCIKASASSRRKDPPFLSVHPTPQPLPWTAACSSKNCASNASESSSPSRSKKVCLSPSPPPSLGADIDMSVLTPPNESTTVERVRRPTNAFNLGLFMNVPQKSNDEIEFS